MGILWAQPTSKETAHRVQVRRLNSLYSAQGLTAMSLTLHNSRGPGDKMVSALPSPKAAEKSNAGHRSGNPTDAQHSIFPRLSATAEQIRKFAE
jgi:hypothetical protein